MDASPNAGLSFYLSSMPTLHIHPANAARTTSGAAGSSGQSGTLYAFGLKHPVRGQKLNLNTCTRLVVFNTRGCTVQQFWWELRRILTEKEVEQVFKVRRIVNRRSNPHMVMWVRTDVMSSFVRLLGAGTRQRSYTMMDAFQNIFKDYREGGEYNFSTRVTSSWRIALWRSLYDRKGRRTNSSNSDKGLGSQTRNIATWNVDGFCSKRNQIEDLLISEQLAVLAIQETKVSGKRYVISVKGYKTFSVLKGGGFMGHSILVDNKYPAYEIAHKIKQMLHVKVAGIPQFQKPIHILAVYLPAGGNFRGKRWELLRNVRQIAKDLVKKDPKTIVFVLGDFNISDKMLDERLAKHGSHGLKRIVPVDSAISRFPRRGRGSAIDHILASKEGARFIENIRVGREFNISDHRPVIMRTKEGDESLWELPKRSLRVNDKMLWIRGKAIVDDNRWNVLLDMPASTLEHMTILTDKMSDTIKQICIEKEVFHSHISPQRLHMPRRLKSLLEEYKRCSGAIAKYLEEGTVPEKNRADYIAARKAFRKENKRVKRQKNKKAFNDMASDFLSHDLKKVWHRIRSLSGQSTSNTLHPVRDRNNNLATETKEILQVVKDHYQAITNHDPLNLSKNKEHWGNVDMEEPPKEELMGLNQDVTWKEVILAIRGMNKGTSAGKDYMHVNVLKMMVKEECMSELEQRNDNFRRQDQIQINLPEWELPGQPNTPMGKALYKVLAGVWKLEKVPELWTEVYVVNLLKPGDLDPEQMTNYRGISLISCTFKVLLSIMAERLATAAEREKLLVKEQSGFRKKEEAITQFLAIAEVVRGRQVQGLPTYGVFIDFSKAYDRVHHELLYKLLDHYGVRGKFLELVRSMYDNSKMTVKTGGFLAEPFMMHRGNRQGCPLSPLLFIILMNSIFKGDKWPGVYTRANVDRCKGGMYADDVIMLAETPERAKEAAEALYQWGQKWGMTINVAKSAVICFTDDAEILENHKSFNYKVTCGEIPAGTNYKYLGIVVDHRLGFSRECRGGTNNPNNSRSLEKDHVRKLAKKGRRALNSMRPILEDKYCTLILKAQMLRTLIIPMMTYGAEWFAFKQENASPSQKVLGRGAQWALGVNANSESDIFTLGYELGLPVMEAEIARLRTRLIMKLKDSKGLKTWLQLLNNNPMKSRKRTWVDMNEYWVKLYVDPIVDKYMDREIGNNMGQPLREWAAYGRMFELDRRSNEYSSDWMEKVRELLTGVDRYNLPTELTDELGLPNFTRERMSQMYGTKGERNLYTYNRMCAVYDSIVERHMVRLETSTGAFKWYNKYQFGASRGFLQSAMARPDLAEGVRWLSVIRTGFFPEPKEHICPMCNNEVDKGWLWAHLMIQCENRICRNSRQQWLHDPIINIARYVREDDLRLTPNNINGVNSQNSIYGGVISVYLVGGVVEGHFNYPYSLAFGQCDGLSADLDTYGYVYVASFLQKVCPVYCSKLGIDVYGLHVEGLL